MWCRPCGQDVPGVASAEDGKYRCPRCSEVLSSSAPSGPSQATAPIMKIRPVGIDLCEEHAPASPAPLAPPPGYNGWEIDEELRHIARVLSMDRHPSACKPAPAGAARVFRVDAAHELPTLRRRRPARRPLATPRSRRGDWPILTWTSLLAGVTALVCGAVLLGWSVGSGRQDLWATGMPITLAGLGGLLLGLILQFDRLRRDNRRTAMKLDQLNVRLSNLNAGTPRLSPGRSSPTTAFYAHVAEATSPKSLLADLKSQLDLLAAKLGQEGN